jgi:energy-coupling factor transporter transmembrane protein EcfT
MWKFFNERWNNSVIVCVFIAFLCFWGLSIPNRYILYTCCFLPFIFLLITFILGIIRIVKKDYLKGILQILSTVILAVLTYGYFSFALMFYPYDFFAEGLKIPDNIKFEKPLKLNDTKDKINTNQQDFILYDYFQSGIYKYDLFLNKIEKGKVYLKIFEITKNQKLSERSIKEESQIEVENKTDELKRFELKDEFTIFEGDWGQFYGARIEVWFKPDDINKPERKLMIKNYIVQGWMR